MINGKVKNSLSFEEKSGMLPYAKKKSFVCKVDVVCFVDKA